MTHPDKNVKLILQISYIIKLPLHTTARLRRPPTQPTNQTNFLWRQAFGPVCSEIASSAGHRQPKRPTLLFHHSTQLHRSPQLVTITSSLLPDIKANITAGHHSTLPFGEHRLPRSRKTLQPHCCHPRSHPCSPEFILVSSQPEHRSTAAG